MRVEKINGKSYVFKLGINAMVEFEKITGEKITSLEENVSMGVLRTLFYCSLKGGGESKTKGMTQEEAGDLMDAYIEEYGMESLAAMIGEVARAGMGKKESERKGNPPAKPKKGSPSTN